MFNTEDKNQVKTSNPGYMGSSPENSEKYKNAELRDNAYLFDESNLDQVVDKRFEVCFSWYAKYSEIYKYIFYSLMAVSAICPMIVTALNAFDFTGVRALISLLSLIAGASFSCACTGEVDGVSECSGILKE